MSQKTYDTDVLTVHTVFPVGPNNSRYNENLVFTANGIQPAFWANPSTLGTTALINQITTDVGAITADASYNILTLLPGSGIEFQTVSTNQLTINSLAFSELDISGSRSLFAFRQNIYQPKLTFAATPPFYVHTNPPINTVILDSSGVQTRIQQLSFQQTQVIENISSIDTASVFPAISSMMNPSSPLIFAGIGDVYLSTDYVNNAIYFTTDYQIGQSFNSVSTLQGNMIHFSSIYTPLSNFSSALTGLSTIETSNYSTSVSSIYGVYSNLSIAIYSLPFVNYTTLNQYNFNLVTLQSAISSFSTNSIDSPTFTTNTINTLQKLQHLSTVSSISSVFFYGENILSMSASNYTQIVGDVSTFSTTYGYSISSLLNVQLSSVVTSFNTVSSLLLYGFSTLSTNGSYAFGTILGSTVAGLGTAGYLSTLSLTSTINGLGNLGYITQNALTSSLVGLGTVGYISTNQLYSTVQGLANLGYITSTQVMSSLQGLDSLGYISSLALTSSFTGIQAGGWYSSLNAPVVSSGIVAVSSITFQDLASGFSYLNAQNGALILNGSALQTGTSLVANNAPKFISSLMYKGQNGLITATNDPTSQYSSFFFSTATVNFSPFSSIITSGTLIFLDFYYTYVFDYWNYPLTNTNFNPYTNIVEFSTCLQYQGVPDLNNIYFDSFVANEPYITIPGRVTGTTSNIYQSNVLSRNVKFQVNTTQVTTNYLQPISVFHYFNKCTYSDSGSIGWGGFNTQTVNVICPSTTSVFVTVFTPASYGSGTGTGTGTGVAVTLYKPYSLSLVLTSGIAVTSWSDSNVYSPLTFTVSLYNTTGNTLVYGPNTVNGTSLSTDYAITLTNSYYFTVDTLYQSATSALATSATVTSSTINVIAPSSLTINIASGYIVISWINTNNTNLSINFVYTVYANGSITAGPTTTANTTVATGLSIVNGVTYYFTVYATCQSQNSTTQTSSSVTANIVTVNIPTDLSIVITTGTPVLNWTDTNSAGVLYVWNLYQNSSLLLGPVTTAANATTATTGATLLSGASYYFTLYASSQGQTSSVATSATQTAITVASLTSLTIDITTGVPIISWTDSNTFGSPTYTYTLYKNSSIVVGPSTTSSTSYTSSISFASGDQLYFTVYVLYQGVISSISASSTTTVPTVQAPTSLGLTYNNSSKLLTLTWSNPNVFTANYYVSFYNTSSGTPVRGPIFISAVRTYTTKYPLVSGNYYYFTVYATYITLNSSTSKSDTYDSTGTILAT
jgi:hypothetical protein